MGHCFSAAGVVEILFGFESLNAQVLFPTFGFSQLDELAEFKEKFIISKEPEDFPTKISFLLKNSFGFGGVNNSILFKALD